METVLDALPDQPLTAEDIATLNEATTVRLIPYTWYGEQVIGILLLHDKRQKQTESAIEDATTEETDGENEDEDAETEETATGFGTNRSSAVGTVEVLEDDSLSPNQSSEETEDTEPTERNESDATAAGDEKPPHGDAEDTNEDDELEVYAVGYDDSAAGWVVIGQIDPDAELTDAEPLIREWIGDRYHDQIVDKLAVGPSEYELGE